MRSDYQRGPTPTYIEPLSFALARTFGVQLVSTVQRSAFSSARPFSGGCRLSLLYWRLHASDPTHPPHRCSQNSNWIGQILIRSMVRIDLYLLQRLCVLRRLGFSRHPVFWSIMQSPIAVNMAFSTPVPTGDTHCSQLQDIPCVFDGSARLCVRPSEGLRTYLEKRLKPPVHLHPSSTGFPISRLASKFDMGVSGSLYLLIIPYRYRRH